MEKYDVIIIGAGIGGLTAGAILAKNGKKVLVLEKNDKVGGYAVNFRRGDFEFDVALHIMDGCNENQVTYNMFKKCGILDKIELLKPKFVYRSIFPDFDFRVPQGNIVGYIDILAGYFPKERRGLRNFFKDMEKIFLDVEKFLYSYLPLPLELVCFPFKYPNLLKYSFSTYENMLKRHIKDSRLRTILSQLWLFYGLPSSRLSSYVYSFPTFDYLSNGATYIKGGGQALSNALSSVIIENGGKVMCNSEVQRIHIDKGVAKGAAVTNEIFFSEMIISNIDANKTFFNLVGENYLKKRFVSKIKKLKPSASVFVVYLGLNVNLKNKGVTDYEIFYNPSYDLDYQSESCLNNNMAEVPFIITIHSNLQDNIVSKERSIMNICTQSGYDFWSNLDTNEYVKKKNELADILIKRAEKIIPKLSSYIEVKEVGTPLTMEKHTADYKGAVFGWSQLVNQSGILRLTSRTPIKNLYLASAWTFPGGGMSAVMHGGERVAEALLKIK